MASCGECPPSHTSSDGGYDSPVDPDPASAVLDGISISSSFKFDAPN